MPVIEILAVVLALAYLVLVIRQNPACWPAAIASAALYGWLMFDAGLYMQSILQLFYIGMAAYGLWYWQHGRISDHELAVIDWPLASQLLPLSGVLLLGLANGAALAHYTDAASPWLDSLTAWGSIYATWLVARKVLQSWHVWFVIDAVLVWLYASQGLWLTAGLFVIYLVLVVIGYRQWRSSMTTPPDAA